MFLWNFFVFYESPLHVAVLCRNIEAVCFLIEVPNIILKAQDKNARTPLHLASMYGFTEAVQAILSKKDPGINMVDNDGRSPLHHAVISGSRNIVILLCSFQGINVNIVDNINDDSDNDDEQKGKTPLQIAQERHYHSICSVLFDHKAVDSMKK